MNRIILTGLVGMLCVLLFPVATTAQAPPFTINANPSNTINAGEYVILTPSVTTYHRWLWSTGETTRVITVSPIVTTDYWLKGLREIGENPPGTLLYDTTVAVYITITVRGEADLVIPNVITPNGDGVNDEFVIPDLVTYVENELTIYNRWMTMVYNSKNYDNKWKGEGLSDGVYYYFLRVRKRDGEDIFHKGYVQIIR